VRALCPARPLVAGSDNDEPLVGECTSVDLDILSAVGDELRTVSSVTLVDALAAGA